MSAVICLELIGRTIGVEQCKVCISHQNVWSWNVSNLKFFCRDESTKEKILFVCFSAPMTQTKQHSVSLGKKFSFIFIKRRKSDYVRRF